MRDQYILVPNLPSLLFLVYIFPCQVVYDTIPPAMGMSLLALQGRLILSPAEPVDAPNRTLTFETGYLTGPHQLDVEQQRLVNHALQNKTDFTSGSNRALADSRAQQLSHQDLTCGHAIHRWNDAIPCSSRQNRELFHPAYQDTLPSLTSMCMTNVL